MTATDFLLWVKGPMFAVAVAIFVIGVVLRLLEILMLGRAVDLAEPRGSELGPGMKTVVTRFAPHAGTFKRAPFNIIVGYLWHLELFICVFLFVPHIEMVRGTLGLSWPGLPTPLVDAATTLTMVLLVAVLVHRLWQPVMRMLSDFDDYLACDLLLSEP